MNEIGEWREPGIEHADDVKQLLSGAAARGDPNTTVKKLHITYEDGSFHNVLVAVATNGKFLAAMRVM